MLSVPRFVKTFVPRFVPGTSHFGAMSLGASLQYLNYLLRQREELIKQIEYNLHLENLIWGQLTVDQAEAVEIADKLHCQIKVLHFLNLNIEREKDLIDGI